jgi:hypothetical protein
MKTTKAILLLAATLLAAPVARADAVIDWNVRANEIVVESKIGSTSSPSAENMTRRWTSVGAFVQEVSDARIYEGIHFRSAVDAGTDMGRQIGALAAQKHFAP